jgi:uncharacterized protein (TIGR02466 family)
VYYVKSEPTTLVDLKYNDPRPGAQIVMPNRKRVNPLSIYGEMSNLAPIPGRIIMFPAWLWHAVEPNNSNDIRISVSFNFIQEGFNV